MTVPSKNLIKGRLGQQVIAEVTPEGADWSYLDFSVITLKTGEEYRRHLTDRETAVTPLAGSGQVKVDGEIFDLNRLGVFDAVPQVLYAPPGREVAIKGRQNFLFAVGGAPAEGGLPVRMFDPTEMRTELRGGGSSHRQISHILSHPLPAERLILYEVYVPRGVWAGWAPHCHDGYADSPYLEEVYYFRLQPAKGFALHRNWREDINFDEVLVCEDGDTALVPKGYHSSVACPGTNMYFLNYLAGELVGDERKQGPYFHPDHTWIHDDWESGKMHLPTANPPNLT